MIYSLFIIKKSEDLIYSKSYTKLPAEIELISGFIKTMDSFAQDFNGGSIEKVEFMDYKFIYSTSESPGLIFALCLDKKDQFIDTKKQLNLFKEKFVENFGEIQPLNGQNIPKDQVDLLLSEFFTQTPQILVVGNKSTNKTTILNLFPGETIITIDDKLNEFKKKSVIVKGLNSISSIDLWDFDLREIINNTTEYQEILTTFDIILFIIDTTRRLNISSIENFNHIRDITGISDKKTYILAAKNDYIDNEISIENLSDIFPSLVSFGINCDAESVEKDLFKIMTEILNLLEC